MIGGVSWRKKLLSYAKGNVLEVGVGCGRNFAYYPTDCTSITAVDFSSQMIECAKLTLRQSQRLKNKSVQMEVIDAHNLPFADNSFDTGFFSHFSLTLSLLLSHFASRYS
jgi:ubiquinone/menaquinone biosynthesis C-methylase UbiE